MDKLTKYNEILFPRLESKYKEGDFPLVSLQPNVTTSICGEEKYPKFPCYVKDKNSTKTKIFFKGNGSHLNDVIYMEEQYSYNMVIPEYYGYGIDNSGLQMNESLLEVIARTTFEYTQKTFPGTQIIVEGYSIGGVAASMLASREMGDKFIIRSSFTKLSDLIYNYLDMSFITCIYYGFYYKFNVVNYLKKCQKPILIIHGDADKLIPVNLGRAIFDSLTSHDKQLLIVEGMNHFGTSDSKDVKERVKTMIVWMDKIEEFINQ